MHTVFDGMAAALHRAAESNREWETRFGERCRSIAATYDIAPEEVARIIGEAVVQRHIENGGEMLAVADVIEGASKATTIDPPSSR
jgi:hypothetical protein